MNDNDSKSYFKGMPTGADVDRLIEKFGVPTEGTIIAYETIAEAIREQAGTSRFRTVTDRWRKRLYRQHNAATVCVTNTGFRVAPPVERVAVASNGAANNLRGVFRAAKLAALTDAERLDDASRRSRDHTMRLGAAIQLVRATEAKALSYPQPK